MHSLITSYLLQSKECVLPGIGVLQIIHTPASTDSAHNRILPAYETIIFKREDRTASPDLVKYIAAKKHIHQGEAEELLNDFCKEWKVKMDAGEKLVFETIGSLQKNAEGIIFFEKEKNVGFFQPININSVYQRTAAPPIIEEEPALPEVNEFEVNQYKEEEKVVIERSYWGLWALILLAVAAVMLFYHFKDHTPSASNIGNQHKFMIDSAAATYQLPK